MKSLYKLFLIFLGISFSVGMYAQKGSKSLSQARIYINPGHGGWGSNDRPLATINYVVKDTLGFFETNTNLLKAEALYDKLKNAGAGYLKMTRTRNGVVAEGDAQTTPNDIFREGDVIDGVTQIVTLRVISQDVETNNMDYFLSIHSNAAAEGALTNYPLLLYRGTDSDVGNGLVEAKNMALDAWQYVNDNELTYHSAHNLPTSNNSRGDITFMNGSTTSDGYTGYYAVLRHGCDGFLSEGCFHTYHPERHRLLNKDYCRQEGVRYSRALRAWFGDNSETKGDIMGTVKDKNEELTHALYKFKSNSVDAYAPLNNVTVELQNSGGTTVATYTTDNEYNGVYVFTDLAPGTYTLVYDIAGYIKETKTIDVVANKTSFINQLMDDGRIPAPDQFLDPYYPTPIQDGDISAAESYKFIEELNLPALESLKDLTIRRTILRDGKYYVLAHDATKNPKLLVINPETGDLLKEMSLDGIVTTGYGGKEYPYILSDIAFTTDGVLIGANSTVVGRENNGFQTGDFYLYKWQGTASDALEDVKPTVVIKLPTNTSESIANAGNNYSNFMANSIAVKGGIDDFFFYFDSHAGNAWNTTYGLNFMAWRVKDGLVVDTQRNTTSYTESDLGADVKMTYSPFGDVNDKDLIHRFILDGNNIEPREMRMNWASAVITELAKFSETLPTASTGANYFRYAGRIYMSAPVCEKQADNQYSYKAYLYDITDGLDKAKQVSVTDAAIIDQANVMFMAGNGVVDNDNINQYLLVGNNIVKYTTKGQLNTQTVARIFAFNLASTKTATGYDISYELNEDANSVNLILIDETSGVESKTIALSGLSKGLNNLSISFSDVPQGSKFRWAIEASADNVTRFVKLSNDSKAYQFFGPKGVAVDKSPESKYFGRVYITNSDAGTNAGRTTSKGVYVLNAEGSDITNQGDDAHDGGISWIGAAGESPRKVAVASDGRVFVCDFSVANSGIYNMNPETFAMASVFDGATRAADGKLTIGGTYVGGQTAAIGFRGEGANTQLYAVDRSAGSAWSKFVATYNIGEDVTITGAPVSSVKPTSFIGNDNSSIAPIATGFWAGQYRGAGSNSAANPCMFYYSDTAKEAVFNSFDAIGISTASQNGALAVNEKEGIVALSNNGGASIYTYTMNDKGVPVVAEKFFSTLQSSGVTYDDFEFDYAGNLYAVSYSGKLVSVWAMPTDNNTSVVPASTSMTLEHDPVGVDVVTDNAVMKVYPNPTTDFVTIESPAVINTVEVYSVAGALLDRINNVGLESVTVDFNRYSQGVYFVRVNGGKSIKVIKK